MTEVSQLGNSQLDYENGNNIHNRTEHNSAFTLFYYYYFFFPYLFQLVALCYIRKIRKTNLYSDSNGTRDKLFFVSLAKRSRELVGVRRK